MAKLKQTGIFKGFRAKVFWSVTLLLLTLAVFLTVIVIYQQGRLLKQDLVTKGLSIVRNIAHDSQLGIFTESSSFLEPVLARHVGLERDLVYAVVFDPKGKVIAIHSKDRGYTPVVSRELIDRFDNKSVPFWFKGSYGKEPVYEFWAPVVVSRGFKTEDLVIDAGEEDSSGETPLFNLGQNEKRLIGMVQVGISLNGIMARQAKIVLASVSITAIFLSFAFLFTYMVAKKITEPLMRLKNGVETIEEGKAFDRIDLEGVDEIGHLASSFNLMVDSLKRKDEEIMRHVQELSTLNAVANAVNKSIDLYSLMQDSLEEVLEVTGMKAGWIYLPTENNDAFKVAAHKGVDDRFVRKIDLLEPGEGLAGKVAASGKPIMLEDISGDQRVSRGAVWDEGFKAFASIPLSSKDKVLGVMNIASYYHHPYTPEEAELLYSIGNLVGTAIENSMLYEKVKKQLGEIESAQDKLVRTARLASLGELSANVAHEINNPLTGVLTHTSMLMEDIPDADPSRKRLGIIYDETMRIRYIVRNLLDFARQAEPRMTVVPVVDVIKDTLNLVSHLAKVANVEIIEDYRPEDSPSVTVDVAQIKQVLLNLFNNALYAMPNGGLLTIEISKTEEWANIHISDTGCGIPGELLTKVFDPFFTTKPETKGTGLGLSVSHGIIEKHSGKIEVESELGKGSTFTVKLPLASR